MSGRARAAWALLLLAALALAGCQGFPGGGAPLEGDSGERREYEAASRALEKDPATGEAAMRAFLSAHPGSPLSDEALLSLAESAQATGRNQQAITDLRALLNADPTGTSSDRARVLLAQLLRQRGDLAAAWGVAQTVRVAELDPAERADALQLLAALAAENGDTLAELRWLARAELDAHGSREASEAAARLDARLAAIDTDALRSLLSGLDGDPPAARVALTLAQRDIARGDFSGAEAALGVASRLPLSKPDAERLVAARRNLEDASRGDPFAALPSFGSIVNLPPDDLTAKPMTIGVLVPLTGPYARFGHEVLDGVLLAAGLFDADRAEPSAIRVLVRDTGGDPQRASAALRELAADDQVLAVVGPLATSECESAAATADDVRVPLLMLSRREGIAAGHPWALRLPSTPRAEAEQLAAYAIEHLGVRRFALLYPEDPFGYALRSDFWQAVVRRGGEVRGVAHYPPGTTDFSAPIRHLVGFDFLTPGEQAALVERGRLMKRAQRLRPEDAAALREKADQITAPGGGPLPPFVDFEAIFLPDAGPNAALIAPHLAFQDVRGVRLLGPSDWQDPQLLPIGGDHLNGAIFSARYFPDSQVPFVARFGEQYRAAFGDEPPVLAAQGWDAARIALAQRLAGAEDRDDMLQLLLRTRAWPGATGIVSIGPDGEAQTRPHLLGVERGHIVSLDEREEPPYLPHDRSAEGQQPPLPGALPE